MGLQHNKGHNLSVLLTYMNPVNYLFKQTKWCLKGKIQLWPFFFFFGVCTALGTSAPGTSRTLWHLLCNLFVMLEMSPFSQCSITLIQEGPLILSAGFDLKYLTQLQRSIAITEKSTKMSASDLQYLLSPLRHIFIKGRVAWKDFSPSSPLHQSS